MEDAITYIHNNIESLNNIDFLPHIYKIFTEVTGVITLDHRYYLSNHYQLYESLTSDLTAYIGPFIQTTQLPKLWMLLKKSTAMF